MKGQLARHRQLAWLRHVFIGVLEACSVARPVDVRIDQVMFGGAEGGNVHLCCQDLSNTFPRLHYAAFFIDLPAAFHQLVRQIGEPLSEASRQRLRNCDWRGCD